jgi:hypothetical protein
MRLFNRQSSHLSPVHGRRHSAPSDPHRRSRAELQVIADHHRDLESPVTARHIA